MTSLLWRMVRHDVQNRYQGSFLGVVWVLITPLLMVALYTFLFSYVFKFKWSDAHPANSPYALVLFAGLIAHGFLAEVLQSSTGVVVGQSNLVKKMVFPLHLLPMVVVLSATFQLLISLGVLLLVQWVCYGWLPLTIIVLPLVLAPLLLLSQGLAWLLGALGVYLRDLGQVMGMIVTALLFSAPVLYPLSALPVESHSWLLLNPLTFMVEQLRRVCLLGHWPDFFGLAWYSLMALVVACLGWLGFEMTRKGFADVL